LKITENGRAPKGKKKKTNPPRGVKKNKKKAWTTDERTVTDETQFMRPNPGTT